MKNFKFLVVALALLSSTTAFAQFSKPSSFSSAGTDEYKRLYASYSLGVASMSGTVIDIDETIPDMKGATVGFALGKSISPNMPLFFEYGAELGFGKATYTDSYEEEGYRYSYKWDENASLTMMNIAIPLNFVYEFPISDDLRIAPYAGLNIKFHLMGKLKDEGTEEYDGDKKSFSEDGSIFDEDDMDGDKAKRFQIGANLGAHVYFKNLVLSYRFQPDFNPLIESEGTKGKFKNQMFSVGIRF